jgi:hypothetical protein
MLAFLWLEVDSVFTPGIEVRNEFERLAGPRMKRDLETCAHAVRINRSSRLTPKATAQRRLVKDLRLAKVSTLEAANAFLEQEYWPEWNTRFAQPVADFPNQHRAVTEYLELATILCHVESRVTGNDYTFPFAGQRYQIAREDVQTGMRRQRLRVELRLNGELKARYQNRSLNIAPCGRCAKDHNAGGKSA